MGDQEQQHIERAWRDPDLIRKRQLRMHEAMSFDRMTAGRRKMRRGKGLSNTLASAASFAFLSLIALQCRAAGRAVEDYVHVPMPPHFRVEATELDGPVFADPSGRTLYVSFDTCELVARM